jgi:hypothetical protein
MLKRHLLNLLTYHHYRLTNATARGFRSFQTSESDPLLPFFLGKLDLSPA